MIRIVVQADIADKIRRAAGQVELIDDQGNRVAVVRRPPTESEVEYAKSRMGSKGPKVTVDELIAKVEADVNYDVVLSMDAVEDVLRITMASGEKLQVVNASRQIQKVLRSDPAAAGDHLSEGLYFLDREPLRAFFTIDIEEMIVEIVHVKQL